MQNSSRSDEGTQSSAGEVHLDSRLVAALIEYDEQRAQNQAGAEAAFLEALHGADVPPAEQESWLRRVNVIGRLASHRYTPQADGAHETEIPAAGVLSLPGLPHPTQAQVAGTRIGRFELVRLLGRGGFGIVYLARDTVLDREVALKLPRPETLASPELRARILNEARAAAALDHPNIVAIHEAGEIGPVCYLASSYCPGQNLAERLAEMQAPFAPRQAAQLVRQLAEAMGYSHRNGIVHRDLKPSNIMLVPQTRGADRESLASPGDELPWVPRVTDFGLAKLVEQNLNDTRSSLVLGTPLYMAPEQASGHAEAGPAADIYALGAILYELLTLRPPFVGDALCEVLDQIRYTPVTPPSQRGAKVARDLEVICLKCLEKRPVDRYASAAALAADLERFLAGEAIHARPVSAWTRLQTWARRRERMREGGAFVMYLNLLVMVWMAWLILLTVTGVSSPAEESHRQIMAQGAGVILGVLCPTILLGYFTQRGHAWAIWIGAVTIGVRALIALGGLFGFPAPFSANYTDPFQKTALYTLMLGMYLLQLAAFVTALIACRAEAANRSSK